MHMRSKRERYICKDMFSCKGIWQEREINTILKQITVIVGMSRITWSIISNLNELHIAETDSENGQITSFNLVTENGKADNEKYSSFNPVT